MRPGLALTTTLAYSVITPLTSFVSALPSRAGGTLSPFSQRPPFHLSEAQPPLPSRAPFSGVTALSPPLNPQDGRLCLGSARLRDRPHSRPPRNPGVPPARLHSPFPGVSAPCPAPGRLSKEGELLSPPPPQLLTAAAAAAAAAWTSRPAQCSDFAGPGRSAETSFLLPGGPGRLARRWGKLGWRGTGREEPGTEASATRRRINETGQVEGRRGRKRGCSRLSRGR